MWRPSTAGVTHTRRLTGRQTAHWKFPIGAFTVRAVTAEAAMSSATRLSAPSPSDSTTEVARSLPGPEREEGRGCRWPPPRHALYCCRAILHRLKARRRGRGPGFAAQLGGPLLRDGPQLRCDGFHRLETPATRGRRAGAPTVGRRSRSGRRGGGARYLSA